MQSTANALPTRLLSAKQICEQHPGIPPGTLRFWLFHRAGNGLDRAVFRAGRRLLIDEGLLLEWLADQSGHGRGGE